MAKAGTVAVLLPGAYHFLRETKLPPIAALRAHGVPMAVATDLNPAPRRCNHCAWRCRWPARISA
jgi:imidazolonepropionase